MVAAAAEPFSEGADVRGFLHRPSAACAGGLVLAHGASSNAGAPLLVAVAETFAAAGFFVLRVNLPYRQRRAGGPPRPGDAAADRDGLRHAAAALRRLASGRLLLGGHSYGGRQASMLVAEDPAVADALLLFSYPLHPPGKPDQLRTAHLSRIAVPVAFLHGARDAFGSIAEMEAAIALIPAPVRLLPIDGAGHDLGRDRRLVAERALAAAGGAGPGRSA